MSAQGVVTPPSGWSATFVARDPANFDTYRSFALYEPADQTLSDWSTPFQIGASGPAGPAGAQGAQGIQGPVGPIGPKGEKGNAGPQGRDGLQGAVGATGPRGIRGLTGDKGDKGDQGDPGPTGAIGPAGPAGQDGADGVDGQQGPAGPAGPTGNPGPVGPQGPAGQRGFRGFQGPRGDRGPAGTGGAGNIDFTSAQADTDKPLKIAVEEETIFVRNEAQDFTLESAGYNAGVSNGTTAWFRSGLALRAYNVSDKQRDSAKDITGFTGNIQGLMADGTTMWLINRSGGNVQAYTMATRQRDTSKDFTMPSGNWRAGTYDGTYLWITNNQGSIIAFNATTLVQDTTKSFNSGAPGRTQGLVANATHLWVVGPQARAYKISDNSRQPYYDLTFPTGAYFSGFRIGTRFWFLNNTTNIVVAYDLVNTLAQKTLDKDGTLAWLAEPANATGPLWASTNNLLQQNLAQDSDRFAEVTPSTNPDWTNLQWRIEPDAPAGVTPAGSGNRLALPAEPIAGQIGWWIYARFGADRSQAQTKGSVFLPFGITNRDDDRTGVVRIGDIFGIIKLWHSGTLKWQFFISESTGAYEIALLGDGVPGLAPIGPNEYIEVYPAIVAGSRGPQGVKGDAGPAGPKGDRGPVGPGGGDQGEKGDKGDKGDRASRWPNRPPRPGWSQRPSR